MSEAESGGCYRVGYALEAKKAKTLMKASVVEHARGRGIELVPVDPTSPLTEQGPFHCLLHKLHHHPTWTTHLLHFSALFPHIPVVDPPHRVHRLLSRLSMLHALPLPTLHLPPPFHLSAPKQRLMDPVDGGDHLGLQFPLVAKPLRADGGPGSHDLLLVFNPQGLRSLTLKDKDKDKDVQTPLLLQEFVNHGGVLFKVYVLGEHVVCVKRSSLPDICCSSPIPEDGVLPFSRISNSPTPTPTTTVTEHEDDLAAVVEAAAAALRHELGLRLFNFDLIRSSSDPNNLFIIDINYFPGYAKIPNYESVFTDFLLDLIHNHNNQPPSSLPSDVVASS